MARPVWGWPEKAGIEVELGEQAGHHGLAFLDGLFLDRIHLLAEPLAGQARRALR